MMRFLLRVPRWVMSGVCFALICYLTLVPKPLPDNDIPFWEHTDKVVHAIMFGGMYACLFLDVWRDRRPAAWRRWLLAPAVAAFGGVIEVLQQTMAIGRGGDALDLAADCVGVILAVVASYFISARA